MAVLLLPLAWLAAFGFIASAAVHVASIAGFTPPGGQAVLLLHVGVFVVWLPAVLVAYRGAGREGGPYRYTGWARGQYFWTSTITACPRWMRIAAAALLAYGVLNFIHFMTTVGGRSPGHCAPSPEVVRGFSGHWMLFYAAAFMVFYARLKRPALLAGRT